MHISELAFPNFVVRHPLAPIFTAAVQFSVLYLTSGRPGSSPGAQTSTNAKVLLAAGPLLYVESLSILDEVEENHSFVLFTERSSCVDLGEEAWFRKVSVLNSSASRSPEVIRTASVEKSKAAVPRVATHKQTSDRLYSRAQAALALTYQASRVVRKLLSAQIQIKVFGIADHVLHKHSICASALRGVMLWVGILHSVRPIRAIAQKNVPPLRRSIKKDPAIWVPEVAQGEASALTGRVFRLGRSGKADLKSGKARWNPKRASFCQRKSRLKRWRVWSWEWDQKVNSAWKHYLGSRARSICILDEYCLVNQG